jgi:hypothetical protein
VRADRRDDACAGTHTHARGRALQAYTAGSCFHSNKQSLDGRAPAINGARPHGSRRPVVVE